MIPRIEQVGGHVAYALFFLWTLFPIVWLLVTSIKPPVLTFELPPVWAFEPRVENYGEILAISEVARAFWNSIVISVLSTILVLLCAVLGGYGYSRFVFRGRDTAAYLLLVTRMFPPVVIVPSIFGFLRATGLYDTHIILILLYASFTVSFSTWMMKSFFDDIPAHIEEAAQIDGYSRLGAFFRATLPLAAPGIVATAIFTFILSWNEFFFAFMFTSAGAKTAPVELVGIILRETGIEWHLMAAGAVLLMIPTLSLSWVIQRYFVKGLGIGAVKG